jgi:mycothiol synthase
MNALPKNFTVRAPLPDDAQAVAELSIARDIDESGKPATNLQEIQMYWRRKNFDLSSDAWLVYAPDGTLAAYGDMWYSTGFARLNNNSSVHPAYKNQGIEEWMLAQAEDWAQARVIEEKITLRHVVNADVPDKVERMTRWGYQPVRNAWIMKIDLDKQPPTPAIPSGIVLRPFRRNRDERAAWACIQEAFRDLWQHEDSPFEEWSNFTLANASWSPELSYLAWDGEELAGATMVMNDELGGWVQNIGVRRPWRGRGVGLALLHTVFHELYKLGVPTAGLEVDAENPSGALHLYERAGMHVDEHFTEYRKELERVAVPA